MQNRSKYESELPHPGPWFEAGNEVRCMPDETDAGEVICEMISSRSPGETSRNKALIVKAPQLVKSLGCVLEMLERYVETKEWSEEDNAVIDKACEVLGMLGYRGADLERFYDDAIRAETAKRNEVAA